MAHAGALLEPRVLVVGMVTGVLLVLAVLTIGTATVMRHQWLVRLQRVLIGVTVAMRFQMLRRQSEIKHTLLPTCCPYLAGAAPSGPSHVWGIKLPCCCRA